MFLHVLFVYFACEFNRNIKQKTSGKHQEKHQKKNLKIREGEANKTCKNIVRKTSL